MHCALTGQFRLMGNLSVAYGPTLGSPSSVVNNGIPNEQIEPEIFLLPYRLSQQISIDHRFRSAPWILLNCVKDFGVSLKFIDVSTSWLSELLGDQRFYFSNVLGFVRAVDRKDLRFSRSIFFLVHYRLVYIGIYWRTIHYRELKIQSKLISLRVMYHPCMM